MDSDSSNSAEGFKYFLDFGLFESFCKMMRDGFRDDGVPTFLIELNSFFKPGEEEISSRKVLVDFLGNAVLLFEESGSTIIAIKLKVSGLDFTESGE